MSVCDLGLGVSPHEAARGIAFLGGVTAWPLAARAQPPAKLPTIEFVGPNTAAVDPPDEAQAAEICCFTRPAEMQPQPPTVDRAPGLAPHW